jgi:hypothetical protein
MKFKTEVWKDIPDYEGLYQASSEGRIRSVDRVILRYNKVTRKSDISEHRKGKVITFNKSGRTGDLNIGARLCKNGMHKKRHVGCWILDAFVETRPNNTTCSHLDGNPLNNIPDNLVWESHTDNCLRKIAHNTVANGERNGSAVLTNDQVVEIKQHIVNDRNTLKCISEAYGVTLSAISRIKCNYTWSHVPWPISKEVKEWIS